MSGAHTHHAIDYIELTVTDLDAAMAFYGAAFGWRFTRYGPAYAGIQRMAGAGESGGLQLDPEGDTAPRGGPLVILYSADLEASLAAVEAAGGRVTAPIFGFPGGRRFELLDPSGNRLAVWTPG